MFHLIFEDEDAKHRLMGVVEGNADEGEEVITSIQTLTSNLITSLQRAEDERIAIAYLSLLCGWLFEDPDAVNDFLGEASSLQSLVQTVLKPGSDLVVVKGLCSFLLGIIYEFSSKDSPVPRRDLQPILTHKLGRERYMDSIAQLRSHPIIRDFEVSPRDSAGGLPDVFFDGQFVDFLKDNFSRITRAIDRDPNLEVQISHQGVDRNLVDSLRGEIDEKVKALEELQSRLLTMEERLAQEQANHRKTQESATTQVNTIKRINEDLHTNHDNDTRKLEREHKQAILDLQNHHNLQLNAINRKVSQAEKDKSNAVSRLKQDYDSQLHESNRARMDLERRLSAAQEDRQEALETIRSLEQTQKKTKDEIAIVQQTIATFKSSLEASEKQISQLQSEKSELDQVIDKQKTEINELKSKAQDQIWKVKDAEDKLRKAETAAQEKEQARKEAQEELEGLMLILSDLEDKREKDKVSRDA